MERDGITFLAVSAHKIHGPKGVGALIAASRRLLAPVFHGGRRQHGLRPGTLNVPGIAGLGKAAELRATEMASDEPSIAARRDRLQAALVNRLGSAISINGDLSARLAGNLHVSFVGCPNTAIIAHVRDVLAVATGAACSSGIEAPSHVLRAMGLPQALQDGAIRIGVGKWTTDEEIERAAESLICSASEVEQLLR